MVRLSCHVACQLSYRGWVGSRAGHAEARDQHMAEVTAAQTQCVPYPADLDKLILSLGTGPLSSAPENRLILLCIHIDWLFAISLSGWAGLLLEGSTLHVNEITLI